MRGESVFIRVEALIPTNGTIASIEGRIGDDRA
jgi:hypothetical protein